MALLARLSALVPPPGMHLTTYLGVISPHAALRPYVLPGFRPVGGFGGGRLKGESVDGGFDVFEEFSPSRAKSFATCSSRLATLAQSSAIVASRSRMTPSASFRVVGGARVVELVTAPLSGSPSCTSSPAALCSAWDSTTRGYFHRATKYEFSVLVGSYGDCGTWFCTGIYGFFQRQ